MMPTTAAGAGLALIMIVTAHPVLAQYQVLTEPDAPVVAQAETFSWRATKSEDGFELDGMVPYASVAELLAARSGSTSGDDLVVGEGAPSAFLRDALAGLDALAMLDEGSVSFEDGEWQLSGHIPDAVARDTLLATLEDEGIAAPRWTIDLSGGAREPITELPPDAESEAIRDEVIGALDQDWSIDVTATSMQEACRASVADFMADRAVLFASGSTRISSESEPVIAGIAERLAVCPRAPVYVEGHTDADGGAQANLELSLARAEAVVDALIALGISPSRLYAVGYGASLPIASNDTAAGKAQNRRIVFGFEDIATTQGDGE